jgi:hypothetical protein
VALVLFSTACGKSEAEKQAEQAAEDIRKAAEAVAVAAGAQPAGEDAAKGMADMTAAMQGMAAALAGGDGKTVAPVTTGALEGTLPQLSGWERSTPRSERMTSPIPYAQSEAAYTKGDADIEVRVVDTAFAPAMIAPWSMMLASGFSRETGDGYEKATSVGGNPGFERWEKNAKSGELNVLLGKRFLVTIEGSDLADTKILHEIAAQMDLNRIAGLK